MTAKNLLSINIGSSSCKLAYFDLPPTGGEPELISFMNIDIPKLDVSTIATRISDSTNEWKKKSGAIAPDYIAHRVVHGGVKFVAPVEITSAVLTKLNELIPLAPLHQPANIAGIEATQKLFPTAKQFACFDTAFHRGQPWVADTYALPHAYYDAGVRRYGFHGLSVAYAARKLATSYPQLSNGRVIIAHLGSGASMCALLAGKSIASTMGFSTLDGLAMATRCGEIDPGVLLYLASEKKMRISEISELLYHRSGLLGLSGISSDMRTLLESSEPGAVRAVEYFVYRALQGVGQLTAALGGCDAIVFTGGIGEHSLEIRQRILRELTWLGVNLDEEANNSVGKDMARITAADSKVSAFVLKANEELMMAIEVQRLLLGS